MFTIKLCDNGNCVVWDASGEVFAKLGPFVNRKLDVVCHTKTIKGQHWTFDQSRNRWIMQCPLMNEVLEECNELLIKDVECFLVDKNK